MDFFLWGFLKDRVFVTPPANPEDLKNRIREARAQITPMMLRSVSSNFMRRIQKSIEVGGRILEHLL